MAAVIFSDDQNDRLFTCVYPFSWNDILASLRKLYHCHMFINGLPNLGRDLSKVANQKV